MKFEPKLYKLSNGIPVLLDPMDLETTNVKVHFKTGARDEAPHEHGLTHFCEHMLCKGTKRFPTKTIIDDYMDYNSGTVGAGTSPSDLEFHGRILAENVNVLIDLLGDELQNSLFLPEKIEIERQVISDELRRALDNSADQLRELISRKLLGGASGSLIRNLGSFANIESFTREQMLEFLSRRLSAKNCIIGISGKINDANSVLKSLDKTFGWLKPIEVPENTAINYTPSVAHDSQPHRKNENLRIYFPKIWTPTLEHMFNTMCVGIFERFMIDKLYDTLRHENGLVYGLRGSRVGNEKFGINGLDTETSAKNIEKCVALAARHAYKIYNENAISNEDLDRYRRRNRLGDADWLESADKRCDKLIEFYSDYGRVYDFYETIRMYASIKPEDVIKNSRGYFNGQLSIITQGADYKSNLKEVWEENFKQDAPCQQNLLLPQMMEKLAADR